MRWQRATSPRAIDHSRNWLPRWKTTRRRPYWRPNCIRWPTRSRFRHSALPAPAAPANRRWRMNWSAASASIRTMHCISRWFRSIHRAANRAAHCWATASAWMRSIPGNMVCASSCVHWRHAKRVPKSRKRCLTWSLRARWPASIWWLSRPPASARATPQSCRMLTWACM